MKLLLLVVLALSYSCENVSKQEENVKKTEVRKSSNEELVLTSSGLSLQTVDAQESVDRENEVAEKKLVDLPELVISAAIESRIIGRDSGNAITSEFLRRCVEEKNKVYFEFRCSDLLWPYYVKIINNLIVVIADGASVENRVLFKVEHSKIKKIQDPIAEMFTIEVVVKLLNKRFPGKTYTEEALGKIAHSHFRTKVPKEKSDYLIILSGELGSDDAYKPIAKIKWTGTSFEIVDE